MTHLKIPFECYLDGADDAADVLFSGQKVEEMFDENASSQRIFVGFAVGGGGVGDDRIGTGSRQEQRCRRCHTTFSNCPANVQ